MIEFKNLPNKTTPISAENLNKLQKDILEALNPIGHIRMETTNINPKTYLGFGIWELWGQGRVPVGVDTTQTEFNAVEKTGGEKTHKLTIDEMPSHTHKIDNLNNDSTGITAFCNTTSPGFEDPQTGSGDRQFQFIQNKETGGSQPHNNLQPYITCYMWKRTA